MLVLLIIIFYHLILSHNTCTHEMLFLASIIRYELCAAQVAKLKRMALENEKSSDSSPCEVEMAEAKHAEHLAPPSP
jgi:hypothetical protein